MNELQLQHLIAKPDSYFLRMGVQEILTLNLELNKVSLEYSDPCRDLVFELKAKLTPFISEAVDRRVQESNDLIESIEELLAQHLDSDDDEPVTEAKIIEFKPRK